jgi:hypothetical protein
MHHIVHVIKCLPNNWSPQAEIWDTLLDSRHFLYSQNIQNLAKEKHKIKYNAV